MNLEEEYNKLSKKYGMFIALVDDQFNSRKKANTEYVTLGAGFICPAANVKDLVTDFRDVIHKSHRLGIEPCPEASELKRPDWYNVFQMTILAHSCMLAGTSLPAAYISAITTKLEE